MKFSANTVHDGISRKLFHLSLIIELKIEYPLGLNHTVPNNVVNKESYAIAKVNHNLENTGCSLVKKADADLTTSSLWSKLWFKVSCIQKQHTMAYKFATLFFPK